MQIVFKTQIDNRMKLNQILRAVTLLSVTCGFALASTSCEEENNNSSDANFAKGTVEGYVTDAQSARLADVKVTLLTTNAKSTFIHSDSFPLTFFGKVNVSAVRLFSIFT